MVQTKREIEALLTSAGLRPKRRFGQNFLIDGNLMRILVASADLAPSDVVVEVGAGTGSLTELLAASAGRVIAIEVDRGLAHLVGERVSALANVEVICADVLESKHEILPRLLDSVRVAISGGAAFKLVANLPYSVASPLVAELLLGETVPALMVFTVQLELAQRIVASPSTRDYGHLAVVVQALARAEVLRELPPSVFWPEPKVAGAMVRITPSGEFRSRIVDLAVFHTIVDGLFAYRRKRCAKSLTLFAGTRDLADDWHAALASVGIESLGPAPRAAP
ncbi:MAG: 16S rRNA (adenine(1518)-N(6)/adenine(1519)-N(6))-dimethyltransferase RsmA, partial [Planctomycetia bacterium]|nr:16S rRNA (adenine(1518)-N(6)/adenine(1519)-N(6))-dimethyltransferase RsmA [Planctomycetia bacterium]